MSLPPLLEKEFGKVSTLAGKTVHESNNTEASGWLTEKGYVKKEIWVKEDANLAEAFEHHSKPNKGKFDMYIRGQETNFCFSNIGEYKDGRDNIIKCAKLAYEGEK